MFEVANSAAELPSPLFLLVSLAAHVAGIVLLLTVQLPARDPDVRVPVPRAALISPYLWPVPRPPLERSPQSHHIRPRRNQNSRPMLPPRRFSAPAVPSRPTGAITIAGPAPPVLEAPRLAAPIPKTGRFDPPLAAGIPVKVAGFSSAEAAAPEPARRTSLAAGSFDPAPSDERTLQSGLAIRTDGFTDATRAAPVSPRRAAVVNGGFADSVAVAQAPFAYPPAPGLALSPAEILFKPQPAYTDEARRLKIEGEVLLEVRFEASGEVQVLRLLRGLGHGLDENANAAARRIRFRPAQSKGRPVDSSAVVHIVFQLAY